MPITHEMLLKTAQCTGAALERADELFKKQAEEQEKVASVVPGVSKKLIDAGLIEPHESEDLRRVLGDHSQTLELMGKVAMHYANSLAEVNADSLGKPENGTVKKASASELGSGYVGARTGRLSDADKAWYQMMTGKLPE